MGDAPRDQMDGLPPVGLQPKPDRRAGAHRQEVRRRLRAEFLEMGCLAVTVVEAARLFGLPHDVCARMLNELAEEGFLSRHAGGRFVRSDRTP
jgi:hypothetical protein